MKSVRAKVILNLKTKTAERNVTSEKQKKEEGKKMCGR
jgi:hypothetical protein